MGENGYKRSDAQSVSISTEAARAQGPSENDLSSVGRRHQDNATRQHTSSRREQGDNRSAHDRMQAIDKGLG